MSAGAQSPSFEMASVLFMDIVSYSLQTIDKQTELLTILQKAVRESAEFRHAHDRKDLISLPTGDGMALVFLRDPVSPVKCALEIAKSLESDPEIRLRMGVHTGPVARHADIKEEVNVVGGGINLAQRVMDCGDAGHILVSRNVAEVLQQLSGWRDCLQDLGTHEVKHGVKVQLYNLCKDGFGNPELPAKLSSGTSATRAVQESSKSKSPPASQWKTWALIGVLVALVVFVILDPYHIRRPAPVQQRALSYSVTVQKYRDGKPYEDAFRLSGERVFEADYRIWLVFSGSQSGYLYILNEGPNSTKDHPDFNILYPSLINGGSALLEKDRELKVPEGGPIVFDSQKGTEKLWLIWSQETQPELDAVKQWTNTTDRGAIRDPAQLRAIRSFISRYSAAPVVVGHDDNGTVLKGTGAVLVHLLKLDHD